MVIPSTPLVAPVVQPPNRGFVTVLVAGLYVTQAVGIGFLGTGLSIILRSAGIGLDVLGALTLAGLVWPLKFLWAPLVDRFGSARLGHYRSWLLVLQPLMVLVILAMLPFGDLGNLTPIIVLGVLLALLSATQDTASDALAILAMRGSGRGVANGLQVMGGYLGNLLGGGLTVVVYGLWGWTPAILFLAAVTALPIVTIVLTRESRLHAKEVPTARESFRALGSVLRQPGAVVWSIGVMPLAGCGVAIASSLQGPALVDAGWTETEVGILVGVVLGLAGIAGGFLGGVLVRSFSRLVGVVTGVVVTLAGLLLMMVTTFTDGGELGATAATAVTFGGYTIGSAAMQAVAMDYARRSTAATDFTMLITTTQCLSFIVGAGALFAANVVGYEPVAWWSAGLTVVAGVLAVYHLRRLTPGEQAPP